MILMTSHVPMSALFTTYSSCFEHGCKGIIQGIVIACIVHVKAYQPIKLNPDAYAIEDDDG